mmetsp:Transcript_5200/g.16032  ORF Transcript_5200/g.16032 Transcript_5200/m.16032 type:complete len:249 (-) Transcript_5200:590-1336(-)
MWAGPVVEQLLQPVVHEVYVRRGGQARRSSPRGLVDLAAHLQEHVPLDLGHALAVADALHADLAEVHLVARERAGLVGEDVVHLAHLLVEVRGPGHAVYAFVDHVGVAVQEEGLRELHEAHGDEKRDRDVVREEDDEVEEAEDEEEQAALAGAGEVAPVLPGGFVEFRHGAGQGRDEAEHALDEEDARGEASQVLLQVGQLARLPLLAIHHDLGLLAGVDRDAHGPVDVLDLAAAEHDRVLVEGNLVP